MCSPDPLRENSLRCRRPCDIDDDCPCVGGTDPSVCLNDLDPGDGNQGGFCSVCVAHLNECEYRAPDPEMDVACLEDARAPGCYDWLINMPYGCCDPGDECRSVTVGGGEYPSLNVGVCCTELENACTSDDDCCLDTVCNPDSHTCKPCDGLGASHINGCCRGLEDRGDGVCRPVCDERVGATCELCAGVDAHYVCSDELGTVCLPDDPPAASDGTCDGVDDDCDGDLDEDYEGEGSCSFVDPLCPGQSFDGIWACRGGAEQCVANEEYCAYDYESQRMVHGNYSICLQGNRDCETDGNSVCQPNEYCRVNDCWTDSNEQPFYRCWPHGMPYGCIGETPHADQECSSGVLCWTPDERNTTGFSCPIP